MFVHPFPTEQELSDFYNHYHKSKQYRDKMQSKISRAKKRLASLGRKGDLSFLDVGCNLGFATEAGRRLGFKALGIDVDADAIQRAAGFFPEAKFRCLPIRDLADEGPVFDIIYTSEVIEHLLDPLGFLQDIHRIMADGSVLMLTTPDVGHFTLSRKMNKLIKWTTFRPPEHLLYFTRKSLKVLFQRAGFRHVRFCFNFKPTLKVIAFR